MRIIALKHNQFKFFNISNFVNYFIISGSKVEITCDKGFSLKGLSEHTCLESGEWSSSSRCQKVTCPEISTVHLALPESEFGKIATIQCPAGMILLSGGLPVKEQEIRWECGEDGRWTNLTEAPVDPVILDCVSKPPVVCSIPEVSVTLDVYIHT